MGFPEVDDARVSRDGITLRIMQEEYLDEKPREGYMSCLGIIADWHRREDVGDIRHGGDRKVTDTELDALKRGGWALLKRYLRMTEKASHITPIGLLDHSGWHVYIGGGEHRFDPGGWDSGTVGFIYTTPEKMAEIGTDDADVDEVLRQEIECLDQYYRGDVYWYSITRDSDGETLDSCGGMYGFEYAKQEATEAFEREHREHLLNLAQFDGSILFGEVA